jgi:hypothetical protein
MAIPLALLALMGLSLGQIVASPALASELIYPTGSRIGLVPLQGVVAAKGGMGFENPDNNLTITMRELPAAAFEAVDTAIKERKAIPSAMENAVSFQTAAGKAYLSRAGGPNSGPKNNRVSILVSDGKIAGYIAVDVPEAAAKAYGDQAIQKMLASTTIRTEIPADEQLSMLPFRVSELSGFKTVKTLLPGQAVLLLDDGDDEAPLAGAPYVLLSIAPISADQAEGRERIARQLATTIPGIRDARITMSEPMRIGGTAGYETRIEATSVREDKPVTVVQWLRFGGGATLRIVAGAARDTWPESFTRFRAVRDGINPR